MLYSESLSVQHESNLEYTHRHWGSLSVFLLKDPQRLIFNQLITEEPKYQAKALIVATDTINSGGSCSGNYF